MAIETEMTQQDCAFCRIVSGTIPADIIYRNEHILAFHDVHPKAPYHLLVIPQQHITTLNDLAHAEITLTGQLIQTAVTLAKQLGIAEPGYRLVMNCNAGGGQTVFHLHLHLLGGRQMLWPPG